MLDLSIHPVALLENGEPIAFFTNIPLAALTGAQRQRLQRSADYRIREGTRMAVPVSAFSVERVNGGDVFKGYRII